MPPGFRAPFQSEAAPEARMKILIEQEGWVADDQAAFALQLIAGCAKSPVKVIHPLRAQSLFENADVQGLQAAIGVLHEGDFVATLFLVDNLWIGACWAIKGDHVVALNTACTKGVVGEAVGAADYLVARALACQIRNFRFAAAPSRPPAHGLCGHFALADLLYHVLGLAPPNLDQALRSAALLSAAFEMSLQGDRLVQAPHRIGGGPSLLEAGLAATPRRAWGAGSPSRGKSSSSHSGDRQRGYPKGT